MHWNKGQLNIRNFIILLTLLSIQSVKSDKITLECLPESKGNFSSQIGLAVIHHIVNDTEEDGAGIYCSVQDWPGIYAKMELRLLGEPPNQLFVKMVGETLLQLKNSVINCCTKYIFESNRESHLILEEVNSRQNTTGLVRYKCNGQHPLRIDLDGLELLTKSFNSPAISKRAALTDVKDICVTEGKNGDHSKLGKSCNYDGSRWMFDESGNFGCRKCCAGYFWKLNDYESVKGVCRKCPPHYTRTTPNTFTRCRKKDHSRKKPTATSKSPTTQHITVPLGLELFTKNFNSPAISKRAGLPDVEDICVTEGKNGDHSKLGESCNYDGSRWMFDESGNFACRRCCAGYFWKLNDYESVKGVCRKCPPHYTRTKPNTFTRCRKKDHSRKKPRATTKSPTTQPITVPQDSTTKFITSGHLTSTPENKTPSPVLPEIMIEKKDDVAIPSNHLPSTPEIKTPSTVLPETTIEKKEDVASPPDSTTKFITSGHLTSTPENKTPSPVLPETTIEKKEDVASLPDNYLGLIIGFVVVIVAVCVVGGLYVCYKRFRRNRTGTANSSPLLTPSNLPPTPPVQVQVMNDENMLL